MTTLHTYQIAEGKAVPTTVTCEITPGIGIHLVGLADLAAKESLLRTVTALQSGGYSIPGKKTTIDIAPASLRKSASCHDLTIALCIIAGSGQKAFADIDNFVIAGELGLDGCVRPVVGGLLAAEMAVENGFAGVLLPLESAIEAADIEGIKVYGIGCLEDAIRILEGGDGADGLLVRNSEAYRQGRIRAERSARSEETVDFSDIRGCEGAKRAMEIAAAGGHNVLMTGPCESGKDYLARALSGILPPMTREESLQTSRVYSLAGRGDFRGGLIRKRPFRAPHFSASLASLIGGGGEDVVPGEVSLATNGILYLRDITEFPRSALECVRAVAVDGKATICRLRSRHVFPASSLLVASSEKRLDHPITDIFDIQEFVDTSAVKRTSVEHGTSADVALRVQRAREIQAARFAGEGISTNAEMNVRLTEKFCALPEDVREFLQRLLDRTHLSSRAYYRILRIARTIADLEGSQSIRTEHLAEAAGYRFLDRRSDDC